MGAPVDVPLGVVLAAALLAEGAVPTSALSCRRRRTAGE